MSVKSVLVLSLVTRATKLLKVPSQAVVLEALLPGLLLQGFCRTYEFHHLALKSFQTYQSRAQPSPVQPFSS